MKIKRRDGKFKIGRIVLVMEAEAEKRSENERFLLPIL